MNTKKAAAIKHFTICSIHLPQVSPTEVLDWMKILSKSMVCWRHVSKLYKWETIQGPWSNLVSAPYWLTRVFAFTQWFAIARNLMQDDTILLEGKYEIYHVYFQELAPTFFLLRMPWLWHGFQISTFEIQISHIFFEGLRRHTFHNMMVQMTFSVHGGVVREPW